MLQARQDTYQKQLEALAKQQQAANALLTTKPSASTPSSPGEGRPPVEHSRQLQLARLNLIWRVQHQILVVVGAVPAILAGLQLLARVAWAAFCGAASIAAVALGIAVTSGCGWVDELGAVRTSVTQLPHRCWDAWHDSATSNHLGAGLLL